MPCDSIALMADQIVALLIQERDKLNRAIEALQGAKRRGRPPKNPVLGVSAPIASASNGAGRKGPTFSAAQRRKQSERMKAYWAKRRKAAKK